MGFVMFKLSHVQIKLRRSNLYYECFQMVKFFMSGVLKLEESHKQLLEEKKELPEKVDVSSLEDYRSFNKIDNEGKNLFDLSVTKIAS